MDYLSFKNIFFDDNHLIGIVFILALKLNIHISLQVRLHALFWSKPTSLALAPNSPLRIEEPKFEGFRYIMLKLLLFYSKQSKAIRGANVVYRRITSQIDKPSIYDGVFFL